MNLINAQEMSLRLKNKQALHLLDVREAIEFHTYNIGGVNIPLGVLPKILPLPNWNNSDEIIVICKVGLRSATAQSILMENGYTNVRNLAGGLIALQKLR